MTPEQCRKEIDRRYPFFVGLPHTDNTWEEAEEIIQFLITYVSSFDMYCVTKDDKAWVRYCFINKTDALSFRLRFMERLMEYPSDRRHAGGDLHERWQDALRISSTRRFRVIEPAPGGPV
jgi:hypothetical protein